MADSPGSPLSSLASDDLIEDLKTDDRERSIDPIAHGADALLMPPSKRQKTTATPSDAHISSPVMEAPVTEVEISSDSSGDVPGSPATLAMLPDEDPSGHDQVTVCGWERCTAGDLGNMDRLVEHIHTDHIGIRQKKYSCEWFDCTRKGMPHASGYALRAHMRSHTREKPFFCTLPGKQVCACTRDHCPPLEDPGLIWIWSTRRMRSLLHSIRCLGQAYANRTRDGGASTVGSGTEEPFSSPEQDPSAQTDLIGQAARWTTR